MIQSLYTGVSGIRTHEQMLEVVANNLSNVNTVGFKGSRALFEDALSTVLWGSQIGLGVSLSHVSTDFRQSGLQFTGLPYDMAVQGGGFLVVVDSATGTTYYTRDGSFGLDENGYLVAADGLRVQGSADGSDGSALQDLVIASSDPSNPMESFAVDADGKVTVLRADGTTETVGYVALEDFVDPNALVRAGGNLFTAPSDAGARFSSFQTPGTQGLGEIRSGYLEMSNVDMAEEFTSMIRAQRGLQASARIVTTVDEILQEIANLKR